MPSSPLVIVDDWQIALKWYPHFDAIITRKNAEKLVADPKAVAQNSFYPFLRYTQIWQPYRSKAVGKPEKKKRPIRFASRRDAYILSYYRHALSARYEEVLHAEGLSDVVIAYRKLKSDSGRGKSNIEFAKDAFDRIREQGNCAAVALDISSFFEKLDHAVLRKQWCRLLGVEKLPEDHEAIFKALTKYAVVDRDEVYRRLGYLEKRVVNGKLRDVYTVKYDKMPKKLCSNIDFQEKVCGRGGEFKSLVDVNRKPFGIPQGSPISDLLANFYLLDFDRVMKEYCESRGGFYLRYSDDLLLVVPGSDAEAFEICDFASREIVRHGPKLKIKEKKTAALVFEPDGSGAQKFRHVSGNLGFSGLEYLGFRYDGRGVSLRSSTLSNLYRKISGGVKAECYGLVARYPGKDLNFLMSRFNFPQFYQKYGRVRDFDPRSDVRKWTFWTYARRASRVFGKQGLQIPKQLRNYRRIVEQHVHRDLARFLTKAP
ncbi:reverse transcriptase/maturase family protein [soil metagenome]